MRLVVIGSSPAWPNAGSAHSGYVVESGGKRLLLDCGPGVLGRLREREAWPTIHSIAITHFHLDHWGDLVPWVWGSFYRRGHDDERPELWVYRGGRKYLEELGSRLGFPDMFERTFTISEYDGDTPFTTVGLEVLPVRLPHYRLETYGFRVTNGEATLETGESDGEPRGHLSAEEALEAYAASGARNLLLTHRPSELPAPDGVALAYDGMEVEVVPQSVRAGD